MTPYHWQVCPECGCESKLAWGKTKRGVSGWIVVRRGCERGCTMSDRDIVNEFEETNKEKSA